MKRAPSNAMAPSDSEEETAHNIKLCYQAASPSTGGAQCGGVGPGRLYRWDALECGSRYVVGQRIRSAAKRGRTASIRAAAALRERRTKDRNAIPEDEANDVGQGLTKHDWRSLDSESRRFRVPHQRSYVLCSRPHKETRLFQTRREPTKASSVWMIDCYVS